jgi:hypothetical protein
MTNEIKSFRDILRNEFQSRLRLNPHYRLLDFAKDLSTPISRMSEIMSGRSGISTQRALHYAETLSLNSQDRVTFLELVSNECSRTKWTRKNSKEGSSVVDSKTIFSTSFQLPVQKKDEFFEFLRASVVQWSTTNQMPDSLEAKLMIEASK